MKDCEVARKARYPSPAQGSEGLGHGRGHEPEGLAVGGQPNRVGVTAIESGRDAGDEGSVVGKPPVHVVDTLDVKAAPAKRSFQFGQAEVASGLQRSWLLPDADVLGGAIADNAAYAGESEPDLAGDLGRQRDPAAGIVAEEQHRGSTAERGKLATCLAQLVCPDSDKHEIVTVSAGISDDGCAGLGPAVGKDLMRDQAAGRGLIRPRRVAEHMNGVPGGAKVRTIHGADHACSDKEDFRDVPPPLQQPRTLLAGINSVN